MSVTAFMSVGVKAAAFAILLRVIFESVYPIQVSFMPLLWVIAVFTIIVGNVAAIAQRSVKRMLAYSSIAHVGYIMIGLAAGNTLGVESLFVYMLAYMFMSIGAFAVVTAASKAVGGDDIEHFGELHRREPVLAATMAVFLLSLAGIPPLAGFIAKFFIFAAAIKEGLITLAVVGILTSVISLFYYCRIIKAMYLTSSEKYHEKFALSWPMRAALLLTILGTLGMGLYPSPFISFARTSVAVWLGI